MNIKKPVICSWQLFDKDSFQADFGKNVVEFRRNEKKQEKSCIIHIITPTGD
nr:hypothetical protein [uncultured Acetatifactor sp.]